EQPDLVWGLIASMFVGNLMLLIMNLPLAPFFAMLLRVPYAYLAPGILLLSVIGAYASSLRLFTVGVALTAGVVGYLMVKARLPRAPLILGIVLAPIMEQALRQSLMMSHGSISIFFTRPVALALVILVALSLLFPLLAGLATRATGRRQAQAEASGSDAT